MLYLLGQTTRKVSALGSVNLVIKRDRAAKKQQGFRRVVLRPILILDILGEIPLPVWLGHEVGAEEIVVVFVGIPIPAQIPRRLVQPDLHRLRRYSD